MRGDSVLRSTYMIANDLTFSFVGNMKTARFSTPIVLLKDKYILAAGGMTKWNHPYIPPMTQATEVFDTQTKLWFNLAPLKEPRGATSMTQIDNRHVFIFNGLQFKHDKPNAIEYLDLGVCDPASFKKARWEAIALKDKPNGIEYNEPRASHRISAKEIIVFGGQGNYTYLVDVESIIANKKTIFGGPSARCKKLPDESKLLSPITKFIRPGCEGTDF